MEFKDLIKANRLALQETQTDYAKRFHISHAALSDIERGVTTYIPTAMIDFVLRGQYREDCVVCEGKGYILRERIR